MKRNLLSFASLVALVALVSFTSCKKEEQVVATFTASMESCSDIHNAKTVLDGTTLKWMSGDEVKIYSDGTDAVFTATPQSNATKATFTTTDLTFEAGNSFIAYYPVNSVVNSVTIPATQESADGSLRNFPMHAYSTSNALQFTNLCGVLKLRLQKSNVTVTSIALTTEQTINGTYQVNNYNSTGIATLNTTSVTNGTKTTTMECNQSIDQLHDFYIYLPAGTYSGLKLVITASDGSFCIKGPAPAGHNVVIERSKYSTLTLSGDDLTFGEPPTTTANPLTFEAKVSNATVSFNSPSSIGATMVYSTDGGNSWTSYTNNTDITLANVGDKVSFRAADNSSVLGGRNANNRISSRFTVTGGCYLYGNIMSLLTSEYENATTLDDYDSYTFAHLFYGVKTIYSHPTKQLLMPATELISYCYDHMFDGCTNLTTAPALPATELASYCYSGMFSKTALTTAPALPATTLANNCYDHMFYDCDNLTTAPALPATTLEIGCYKYMFSRCDNLTVAPDLPAETLVGECYESMFQYCNRLSFIRCYATTGIDVNNNSINGFVGKSSTATIHRTFYRPAGVNWPYGWNGVVTDYWTLADLTE